MKEVRPDLVPLPMMARPDLVPLPMVARLDFRWEVADLAFLPREAVTALRRAEVDLDLALEVDFWDDLVSFLDESESSLDESESFLDLESFSGVTRMLAGVSGMMEDL